MSPNVAYRRGYRAEDMSVRTLGQRQWVVYAGRTVPLYSSASVFSVCRWVAELRRFES